MRPSGRSAATRSSGQPTTSSTTPSPRMEQSGPTRYASCARPVSGKSGHASAGRLRPRAGRGQSRSSGTRQTHPTGATASAPFRSCGLERDSRRKRSRRLVGGGCSRRGPAVWRPQLRWPPQRQYGQAAPWGRYDCFSVSCLVTQGLVLSLGCALLLATSRSIAACLRSPPCLTARARATSLRGRVYGSLRGSCSCQSLWSSRCSLGRRPRSC
jgi:hypothetical protein